MDDAHKSLLHGVSAGPSASEVAAGGDQMSVGSVDEAPTSLAHESLAAGGSGVTGQPSLADVSSDAGQRSSVRGPVKRSSGMNKTPQALGRKRRYRRRRRPDPTAVAGHDNKHRSAQQADQRVSRCAVCVRQFGQNFFSSKRSGSLRRFLRVM